MPTIKPTRIDRKLDSIEAATVTADVVNIVIGTQPSGQGHETSFAQVASDLLGVPVASINIITGDTDIVTAGGGSTVPTFVVEAR